MKKNHLFLVLFEMFIIFAVSHSQAQDVPPVYKLKTRELNPVTNQVELTTETSEIGVNESQDKLSVHFKSIRITNTPKKYKYQLHISSYADLGCSGINDNYVKIKFEDGEIIKLEKDVAVTNCINPVESVYELGEESLVILKTKNVESIKLKQSKYYSDFDIWYPDFFARSVRFLERH